MTTTTAEAATQEPRHQEGVRELSDRGAELVGQALLWLMPVLAVLLVMLQH